MRPRAILAIVLLTGFPPAVMAGAGSLSGSLWAGASGLQVKLTEDGNEFVLRVQHGLFGFLSAVDNGQVLLRGYRSGDHFTGKAYAFASGCTFTYFVSGNIGPTVISWQGAEPKERLPNTCRVTRTELVSTSVHLKWAPPAPTPPPASPAWVPPPIPPVVKAAPPPRRVAPSPSYFSDTLTVEMMVAIGIAVAIAIPLAAFALRWVYLRLAGILVSARLSLAEKRSQLSSIAPASRSGPGLTAPEIENMLAAGFSEIGPELRAALARALAAAIKDKRGA